jgi:hypothetical protein
MRETERIALIKFDRESHLGTVGVYVALTGLAFVHPGSKRPRSCRHCLAKSEESHIWRSFGEPPHLPWNQIDSAAQPGLLKDA